MPYRKPASWGLVKPPAGSLQDWQHPIARNQIGNWLFNEGAGTLLRNVGSAIVRGNNGVGAVATVPVWSNGRFGKALTFASGSYAIAGGATDAYSFTTTSKFSLAAWVKTTSAGVQGVISKWDTGLGVIGYFLRVYLGVVNLQLQSSGTDYKVKIGDIAVNDGKWHHILVTHDGSATLAGMAIYVDGKLDPASGSTQGGTLISFTNTYTMIIGNLDQGGSHTANPFIGQIDNPRIWTRALTQREAQLLYTEPFADIIVPRRRIINTPPASPRTQSSMFLVF